MPQSDLAKLQAVLAHVRYRWLAGRWLTGITNMCLGFSVVLSVVLFVELVITPPGMPTLLLVVLAAVAMGGIATRALWPLRIQPTTRQVARFLEERWPELDDCVASAVQLAESTRSEEFRELVLADAVRQLRTLDLKNAVTNAYLGRVGFRGGLSITLLVAVLTFGFGPIRGLVTTAWLYAVPSNLVLEIEPGDVNLMAGELLRVEARLVGGMDLVSRSPMVLSILDNSGQQGIEMRPSGDAYMAEFTPVDRSFRYEITTATLRSREYRVEVVSPPQVSQVDVEYVYPAFMGLSPRLEEGSGDVFAPVGTEVRLRVHADKPVAAGVLVFGDGQRVPFDMTSRETPVANFTVKTDGSYRVALTDEYGLTNTGMDEYFIRAIPDRQPNVRVLRPGGDRDVTPLEEVTIQVRADDDHRIDALELVYRVSGQQERLLSFDMQGSAQVVAGTRTLYLEELDVVPGDFVTYHARVRDAGSADQTAGARSGIFFLEVRSFDSEFKEAESQSGGGFGPQEMGNLVELQKQVIVATWRLDQEVDKALVAQDILAVAEAQRELTETTSRTAEQMRRAARDPALGAEGSATESLAMEAAVEAMAIAEAALLEFDTGTAILSEMEALNQILTVEASTRSRQVSMARGQGAQSPGGQSQQDLSALFDQELLREQETSYETNSSAGSSSSDDESEAIRRLKELAFRQERLNQELRGGDAARSDGERRRLLERLTREQQALREELEQLAAQFPRQMQGLGGQNQSGVTGIGQIAENMRRTAGGLQRANTEAAGERGAEVLDELRDLERQFSEGVSGERVKQLESLRFEVQELAETQSRIAQGVGQVVEQSRSEQVGSRTQNQLADEKEVLADRVDAFRESIRSMEALGDGSSPSDRSMVDSLRVARETFDRESVSSRMRMGAERLRRAADSTPSFAGAVELDRLAVEETALAEALEVVEGLLQGAGGRGGSQQQLRAQLSTAQLLRQRLNQLEVELERQLGKSLREGADWQTSPEAQEPFTVGDSESTGRAKPGTRPGLSESGESRPGGAGVTGGPVDWASKAMREFVEGLERYPGLLERLRRANPDLDRDLQQWAQPWRSGASPGSELFKWDLRDWASLRRNLNNALQSVETEDTRGLAAGELRDRMVAGSAGTLPSRYQSMVDRYFRSVATGLTLP